MRKHDHLVEPLLGTFWHLEAVEALAPTAARSRRRRALAGLLVRLGALIAALVWL
jgi:hypothetical protein